jgi:anti-sigma B factor antagonist
MGGELTEVLYSRVKELVANGFSLVVVDLSQVPWVNSSGIGTLMGCRSECAGEDGQFALVNANNRIEELLKSLKLDTILVCHGAMDEAVTELGGELTGGSQ